MDYRGGVDMKWRGLMVSAIVVVVVVLLLVGLNLVFIFEQGHSQEDRMHACNKMVGCDSLLCKGQNPYVGTMVQNNYLLQYQICYHQWEVKEFGHCGGG